MNRLILIWNTSLFVMKKNNFCLQVGMKEGKTLAKKRINSIKKIGGLEFIKKLQKEIYSEEQED